MEYMIKKTSMTDISLDSTEWENANKAEISCVNWSEFPSSPYAYARVLHSKEGLFVRIDSEEGEIIAEYKNLNDNVFQDSACEFFFRPDMEDRRYLNFEFNAIGTPLIGLGDNKPRVRLDLKDISIFKIESEITDKGFKVKFFVPYSFMKEYFNNISDNFMGNFQLCCEKKEPMHFLSHFPIKTEKPNFHCSDFFGKLVFER